jgi:ATP-dependent Zn protease
MGNKIYYENYIQEEGERWKKDKYIDVQELLQESYEATKEVLKNNYEKAIKLSNLLQEKKVLYKKDLDNFKIESYF